MGRTAWTTTERRPTRQISVGGVAVGGGAPVTVQSMTTTKTADAEGTLSQIYALAAAGADLVRCTCNEEAAAEGLARIVPRSPVPIIADIHFHHEMALAALEAGVNGLRLNPGNLRKEAEIKQVAAEAKDRGVPIRIGVNAGSLHPELYKRFGGATPEALVESARMELAYFAEVGFDDVKISVKASSVPLMIESYRLASETFDHPLHLGVTEAGPPPAGLLKGTAGIATLLAEGIGDTIRYSLTADPVEEARAGRQLLEALGLRERKGLDLIACPSCGRAEIDVIAVAKAAQAALEDRNLPIQVAVMGCVVNGPGEAREADLGIAAGRKRGHLFIKGKIVRVVPEDEMVSALVAEAERLVAEGVEARRAAADVGAEAEAEADRRELLEAKGDDANASETKVELIRKAVRRASSRPEPRSGRAGGTSHRSRGWCAAPVGSPTMRMSRLLVRTLREAPADAEVASHQLLVRGGYIRRLASGVYSFLPLGLRVLQQLERVIRQELDAAGGQELLLPALHPIELWEQSGRAAMFGSDALPAMHRRGPGRLLRPRPHPRGGGDGDRGCRDRLLPAASGDGVPDPGQVPRRGPAPVWPASDPRADHGRRLLIRCGQGGHGGPYRAVFDAYLRIFGRLDLEVVPVEATSGAIGGDVNHEFMVPSVVGEDHFVSCPSCGYAANIEAATRGRASAPTSAPRRHRLARTGLIEHHTPDRPGIDRRGRATSTTAAVTAADLLKSLAVVDDRGSPALVLVVPGEREARLPHGWRLFERSGLRRRTRRPGQGLHRTDGPAGRRGSGWWPTSEWPGPGRGSWVPTARTTT